MTFGNRSFPESYVTFCARETRIFFLRINFEIQNSAFIRGGSNVTAISAAARLHRHLHRFEIDGTESRGVNLVTIQAIQIRMLAAFVPESARGHAATPTREHSRVRAHACGQRPIEINVRWSRRLQFMTHLAVVRLGRDA